MRLNKYIAHSGVASRRHSDELIIAGRVAVNGETVNTPGTRVQPNTDHVTVDNQTIEPTIEQYYFVLNKPVGYITTVTDPFNRKTVMSLLQEIPHRVFPVGRLDCDSEGILLFTNDGDLSYEMIHPRFGVEKEYRVLLQGHPDRDVIQNLRDGIPLDNRMTGPCQVQIHAQDKDTTWLTIILHEGRNRQIRHMCKYIGYSVMRLIRVRFGPIILGHLSPGQWRALSDTEVLDLKDQLIKA